MSGPRFLPDVNLDTISQGSERAVALAFSRTLESSWTIFHSYCWLRSKQGHQKERLVEGEADFVLLHPQWGLYVLEVKGGRVDYDSSRGLWRQNDHQMKCPFDQAQKNMHALIEQIQERVVFTGRTFGKNMPCPFGYMVCFPDCTYSGHLPPGGHPSITFSADDLPRLGERIRAAAKHWAATPSPQPMVPSDKAALEKALKSDFKIVVSLARRLDQDEEILVQLTDDQAEKLDGLHRNRRVAVEGVAGSGKTLLALLRARSFAEEGKEVLFLTFNRKLADSLACRVSGLPNLKLINFHSLCKERCELAGLDFKPPKDRQEAEAFWGQEVAELLLDTADSLPEVKYDVIIVDEAQDFKEDWWTAIEYLQREKNGHFYVFYDRAQNLFGRDLVFPATDAHFDLKVNCRNTKSIAASCGQVISAELRTPRFTPQGEPPLVISNSKAEEIRKQCASILAQTITNQKISPSRVAILSTRSPDKSCLGKKVGDYPVTDDPATWHQGKAVWFSSVKAFKGLEADILILIEVEGFDDKYFTRHDLYVAASRARHRLVVLTKSDDVKEALRA